MIIRIHRWQPRQNRYHVKKYEIKNSVAADTSNPNIPQIGGGQTFFGIATGEGMEGFLALRNHAITRVEVDSFQETINIYTAPTTERPYVKSNRGLHMNAAKHEACDTLIKPYQDHSFEPSSSRGICRICGESIYNHKPLRRINLGRGTK